jgi:hypothetical protein
MKTSIKSIAVFSIIALLTIFPIASPAQNGDPPPPPAEHGENGNQLPGGGAPIGSGPVLLISLAAGYGGKKAYDFRKKNLAE